MTDYSVGGRGIERGERKGENRVIESMGDKVRERERERVRARAYAVPYVSLRGMIMCQGAENITPQALQPCKYMKWNGSLLWFATISIPAFKVQIPVIQSVFNADISQYKNKNHILSSPISSSSFRLSTHYISHIYRPSSFCAFQLFSLYHFLTASNVIQISHFASRFLVCCSNTVYVQCKTFMCSQNVQCTQHMWNGKY